MNPYEVLGVDRNAKDETIKRAYKKLARKWHPDLFQNEEEKHTAEDKMKEINGAFELIGSPETKAAYDATNPVTVYEYYAKKQNSKNSHTKSTASSSDIEMEKQRKAVLQFLEVEHEHKDDIIDMFAELATGALNNDFSDEEYHETLQLIREEKSNCIRNFEKIISVAKEKHITGLDLAFAKAEEAIEELRKKSYETPATLKQAHYAEETRLLTEKISDMVMNKLAGRINAITNFDLLGKTWEFENDEQLNSASENYRKEIKSILSDIDWISKTVKERNIPIDGICFNPSNSDWGESWLSFEECREALEERKHTFNCSNLQSLREIFWEKNCIYSTDKKGQKILIGFKCNITGGTFICPPFITGIRDDTFCFIRSITSVKINANLITKKSKLCMPDPLKTLIFTFGNRSQVVDVSSWKETCISFECDYICISPRYHWDGKGFVLVDSNNVYIYDNQKCRSLYGVKTDEELPDRYPRDEKERYHIHTWAQVAKKLVDPSIMEFLPCSGESIKNWINLDTTNFTQALSAKNHGYMLGHDNRLIRLYVALGALKDSSSHARAESLIIKFSDCKMYRSRFERFPEENKGKENPMFSVPTSAIDLVENNIENKEFLPYIFSFLEGYSFFNAEAKKAGVELSAEFIISIATKYIFHVQIAKNDSFVKQLLEYERGHDATVVDKILRMHKEQSQHIKNIFETIDSDNSSEMHYKYLNLNSLENYLIFKQDFEGKTYYRVEAENVFVSCNSHAIEIVSKENKRIAIVILNLLDEGELFADICEICDYSADEITILETIRRAIIDQKRCNSLVTGISIGTNEDPNAKNNSFRSKTEFSILAWCKDIKWIKFEYLFKCQLFSSSYKGYRARFMVEGQSQKLESPHPYHKPEPRGNFYW